MSAPIAHAEPHAEVARVLRPGGTLAVLEGTAPAPGPLAGFHRFHLRHIVPLLGRLSPDPSAYRYLSESILEFGAGPEFERDLDAAGFARGRSQSFLLGASRLWTATRRHRTGVGTLPDWKKAIVTLHEDDRIEFF